MNDKLTTMIKARGLNPPTITGMLDGGYTSADYSLQNWWCVLLSFNPSKPHCKSGERRYEKDARNTELDKELGK